MSLGPTNPLNDLLMHMMAASVEKAADAPFESLSCSPALMALQGIKWATNIPIACSICKGEAPTSAP